LAGSVKGGEIMAKLKFTLACSPYDRMHALIDGTVVPEGMEINFIPLEVEEIFWRQLRHQEFDGSEMSLSSYTMARSRGDDRFIAIPVFTSRFFRHSCVYINVNKGISRPEDFKGKTVGVPEYQMTAALWLRGIFQHEYGVSPQEIHWRSGGEEVPGRVEKLNLQLPANVDYQAIPRDKTLSEMIDRGEIDALFTARAPSCFLKGSPNVRRLFEDHVQIEKEYYRKTKIFPIMHALVIKRAIYEANPWVAMSLCKACLASKNITLQSMQHTFALHTTLPWLISYVEETRRLMGDDWWPYGINMNRQTIEALCMYSYEQGLSLRHMAVGELFAPETFDEFKV
jgi:4,5-dihydroxyphthalate decarboxylase